MDGRLTSYLEVKNPIAVARLVLEESCKQLSLQRVPPNLLVGIGATDFASDYNIPILPPDFLVSEGARERWQRWRSDLTAAQEKERRESGDKHQRSQWETRSVPPTPTYSPPVTPQHQANAHSRSLEDMPSPSRPLVASTADLPSLAVNGHHHELSNGQMTPQSYFPRYSPKNPPDWTEHPDSAVDDTLYQTASPLKRQRLDGSYDGSTGDDDDGCLDQILRPSQRSKNPHQDNITDTVGAIAIDGFGNIAAGSSSGGIGMKHKGRCGPAALVGIGTAVIPIDSSDPDRTCVASVTSGTGEHMATTVAAATAADRVYACVKKVQGRLEPCTEDEALTSMIKNDFMKHPGVQNSHCVGAIGILTVKKTRDGIFFYFGHNTDSFALASMHSDERKPVCVMSRSRGNGSVASGGRVARAKRAKHG